MNNFVATQNYQAEVTIIKLVTISWTHSILYRNTERERGNQLNRERERGSERYI